MKQYTRTHEWVELRGDKAYVGITAHAAEELGEIVYVELPEIGAQAAAGEACCELESVKAVAEVNSPASGTVAEVNGELADAPEKAGEDGVWLFAVGDPVLADGLMSESEYEAFLR